MVDSSDGEESLSSVVAERRSKRRRAPTERLQPEEFVVVAAANNNSSSSSSSSRKPAAAPRKRSRRSETLASRLKRETRQRRQAAVRQRREQRRQKRRQASKRNDEEQNGPRVVCDDGEEPYYEVEKVVGKRTRKSRVEFKIRWKGCPESEDSWEPGMNLCDSALEEARLFERRQKEEESRREQDLSFTTEEDQKDGTDKREAIPRQSKVIEGSIEHIEVVPGVPVPVAAKEPSELGTLAPVNEPSEPNITVPMKEPVKTDVPIVGENELPWHWTDKEQVVFHQVARINVNDVDAGDRVTEARTNGTPVVLVGHKGWAGFAKRWLVRDEAQPADGAVAKTDGENDKEGWSDFAKRWLAKDEGHRAEDNAVKKDSENEEELLDLSVPHHLNFASMIKDIGEEEVPVLKRNYDEQAPIHREMNAKTFLETSGADLFPTTTPSNRIENAPKLYLHQWQFPLAEKAGRLLCGQNNPLPHDILGEDLLKYFVLGDEYPQCKSDSPYQYLFMGAKGTTSKLHRDSGGLAITIAPIVGEKECILVHRADGADCLYGLEAKLNNINLQEFPLVSQARIWKTTVRPGEILLMPAGTYHECTNLTSCLSYSRFYLDTVNIRAFFQSMIDHDATEIDHETILYNSAHMLTEKVDEYVVKVRDHVDDPRRCDDVPLTVDIVRAVKTLRCLRNFCREIDRRKVAQAKVKGLSISGEGTSQKGREWHIMTDEIDLTLHDFRYCREKRQPRFNVRETEIVPNASSNVDGSPIVADRCGSLLERAFLKLPDSSVEDSLTVLPDHVQPSVKDVVTISLLGKNVKGEIVEVRSQMSAALVSYEECPSVFDEYQPYDMLRVPRCGESRAEVKYDDVKPGLVVAIKSGSYGEDHRGEVASIAHGTFYHVRLLSLGKKEEVYRWFTRESIVKIEREATGPHEDAPKSDSDKAASLKTESGK